MKKLLMILFVVVAIGFNLSYNLVDDNSSKDLTNLSLVNLKAIADLGDEGDGSGGTRTCFNMIESCHWYGCYNVTACGSCNWVLGDSWSYKGSC